MDFSKELEYVGDISQLFNVKEYVLTGGRAEGEKALDVSTGAGLSFTVLPSRCMDISHLSLKGVNFSFISPCGHAAPQFYDRQGTGFLRSFTAGFLTTCGLDTSGPPDDSEGGERPMHGLINATPAEQFGWSIDISDGVPTLTLRGKMRQAVLFGEHLWLERTYTVRYNENRIHLHDRVYNAAFKPQEHMMLYHFNFGYPLLCEDTVLNIPSKSVVPRDERAAQGLDRWNKVDEPTQDYAEMCFFHDALADERGIAKMGMFNPRLNMGFECEYSALTLPCFLEWKMMNKGEYVMGFEPANNFLGGRAKERAAGRLVTLAAGESRAYDFDFAFQG